MKNNMRLTLDKKNKLRLSFLFKLLSPAGGSIGGLEVGDSHVRFFGVRKNKIKSVGLRIPPGIVNGGVVVAREKFIATLQEIRRELGLKEKEKINIIVALPPDIAYLQAFNLPYLSGESLENAAKLNLQVISPVPFEETYHEWQMIGETADNQLEVVGVFAEKKQVSAIMEACEAAGFLVVAAEPSIFSLARAVHEIGGVNMQEPHIILRASDMGMDFAGIKNNVVSFSYFVSWRSIYGEAAETSKKVFEENVVKHVGRVLTFFAGRGHADMKKLLLITSSLRENFSDVIKKNFNLEVQNVYFGELDRFGADWAIAIGAYMRGLIPRAEDALVSLAGFSTTWEFSKHQIIAFFSLWRNIAGAVLVFLLLAFWGTNFFVQKISDELELQPVPAMRFEDAQELKNLEAAALKFNTLADLINIATEEKKEVTVYFKKILALAEGKVNIKRIYFQSMDSPVSISGDAPTEKIVVNFKDELERQNEFAETNLPFTSLIIEGDHVTFSMTLRIISEKTE